MLPGSAQAARKHILLIDAVVWSPAYPAQSSQRDVRQWYVRWFDGFPEVNFTSLTADAELVSSLGDSVDGVILSGSPRDAWNEDPVNLRLCELVTVCQERRLPFLGVCYGHQLLARALGGVVGRHPQGLELGNTTVELTPAGCQCPLFAGFPTRFEVLSSHADAVLEMPAQGELLVKGEFTLNQGFGWNNLLFGVQFHPETDPDTLRFLWSVRREAWRRQVAFDLDRTLDTLRPTPLAAQVLRNFVNHLVP